MGNRYPRVSIGTETDGVWTPGTVGGGGGGSGDASATNQTAQITIATDTKNRLPASLGPQASADSLSVVMASGVTVPVSIGGPVTPVNLLTAVTATGAGSPAVDAGWTPTFYATASGTGLVTATVLIEVRSSTTGAWVTYGTLSLSGTTSAADAIAGLARYAQYRANCTALSSGASLTVVMTSSAGAAGGGGDASALNQIAGNTSVEAINTNIGAQADAVAPADGTGNYSLFAALKRILQNGATLLSRIPTLGQKAMSAAVPVAISSDQSAVPVQGPLTDIQLRASSLPLPTNAATSVLQGTGNTSLASIDTKFPSQSIPGMLPVDTLAGLGTPRLIAIGSASTNLALTTTTRRVSIHATVAGFYSVGTGVQTATVNSHYIGAGERLDFDVLANSQIAVLRVSADGTLYISELVAV